MTLSTDTQTQALYDGTGRRRGPSRLELYGVGVALAAGIGVVALVGQSGYAPDGPSGYSSGDRTTSAYTRPTEALGGQTLAGYLADHYIDREARAEQRT